MPFINNILVINNKITKKLKVLNCFLFNERIYLFYFIYFFFRAFKSLITTKKKKFVTLCYLIVQRYKIDVFFRKQLFLDNILR